MCVSSTTTCIGDFERNETGRLGTDDLRKNFLACQPQPNVQVGSPAARDGNELELKYPWLHPAARAARDGKDPELKCPRRMSPVRPHRDGKDELEIACPPSHRLSPSGRTGWQGRTCNSLAPRRTDWPSREDELELKWPPVHGLSPVWPSRKDNKLEFKCPHGL